MNPSRVLWGFGLYIALIMLVAFSLGCVTQRGYVQYAAGAPSPYAPSLADTARALDLVARRAPEVLPVTEDQARVILARARITYDPQRRAPPFGAFREGFTMTGLTENRYEVWVYVDASRHDVSTNALVHECIHVLLWAATGSPDEHHEETEWGGWTPAVTAWETDVMRALRTPK